MILQNRKIFWILILLALISGCTSLKIWLDRRGIDDVADLILNDFRPESEHDLKSYLEQIDTIQANQTLPVSQIVIEEQDHWLLEDVPLQRKLIFPSPIKLKNGESDRAIFYLYSHKELEGQKVILWIPGFGVSDFAFRFIKNFFISELNAGYAVLFYNIPYHLNRIEEGKEMGEGLFSGNNQQNLELIAKVQSEIVTVISYLEQKKVASISGWGGSIGAAFLWIASGSYHFGHMTLMIPIVDWTTLIFHDGMVRVVEKMNAAGISNDLIQRTYHQVNPINIPTMTDPKNIQILYSRYDQFTPQEIIIEFARKWNIDQLHSYDESHASILINGQMYEDNQLFLENLYR